MKIPRDVAQEMLLQRIVKKVAEAKSGDAGSLKEIMCGPEKTLPPRKTLMLDLHSLPVE